MKIRPALWLISYKYRNELHWGAGHLFVEVKKRVSDLELFEKIVEETGEKSCVITNMVVVS